MSETSPDKLRDWQRRAAEKGAVVPSDFESFVDHVRLKCGKCGHEFSRNLVPNLNDPVFACPEESCRARNWVPIKYERRS